MRFLADEGVDAAIVSALRSDGHDILWMAEEFRVDGIANERKGWIVPRPSASITPNSLERSR